MSGQDDLNRSQSSAEAETGSVDSPTSQCTDWVGVEAQYDDRWQTKVTDHPVRIEVNGGVVADGPMNQSLKTFGKEDGQRHDSVRDLLSQFKVEGVDPGDAKMCLIPAEIDTAGIEAEIDAKLISFEAAIRGQVGDYISAWAKDGWLSVPEAYRRGLGKGGKAWWDGEVDFWSSVGGAASSAWGSIKTGAVQGANWYAEQPFTDKLMLSSPLLWSTYLGKELLGVLNDWVKDLWDRRDDIMKVAKAFAEGSVNAIQSALEALIDLPGELGELFTDLWKKSNDWVQNMIEVARETDVFQKAFKTIMSVLFMLTPNFWAEMKGMVEGFLIPEIVISAILALIGALCAAAGAAGIAARVAGVVAKIRKAFTAAGAVGRVLSAFFRYIDELFALIGRLSTALRTKIDEAIEGATGAFNRIVRRSGRRVRDPADMPCFTQPPNATRQEFLEQLAEQEIAINNSDLTELMRRRALVRANGTKVLRDATAQSRMRDRWLRERTEELIDLGETRRDASRLAGEEASLLDATHVLDIVAGGDPSDISGLQNRSANRSIGSQWRTRVDSLDEALADQAGRGAIKAHVRLNPC